jgi:BatD DUF11 like domain
VSRARQARALVSRARRIGRRLSGRRLAPLVVAAGALAAGAAWLAAATAARAAAPFQVHVSLEPAVIGLDETATLTIQATGGGLAGLGFEPGYTLENLEVAGGPSRFEDLSLINGSLSRSFRYSLPLRPLGPGAARVRALALQLRGQAVRLPDQEIQVRSERQGGGAGGGAGNGAGGAAGAGGSPGPGAGHRLPRDPADLLEQLFGGGSPLNPAPHAQGPAAFLRAEVQPPRPLVGEQALYTIYLYTRQDVAATMATAMPTFRGFWVRDLPQPERPYPEMVNLGAERYARAAMVRKALFGLRPGRHLLEPAGLDVVIDTPMRPFFGPPVARSEELHLRTPELAVDVQPLPSSPPGFGGVVGQVSLAATLQPYSLRVGEGATLTVTLAGAGNLQGVAAPPLEPAPGLTVFPPQQQSEDKVNGATVLGRRTWTFVVVPNRPGSYSVRPGSILYFDPARREYQLAQSPPLALTALPAPAATAAGGGGRAGAPGAGGAAARRGRAPWSWAALAPAGRQGLLAAGLGLVGVLTLALALVVVVARRRRAAGGLRSADAEGGAGAPAAAAQGPAQPAEVESKLREAAREDRPRQAAALVEAGWRGYLARRWGLPLTTPPGRWGAVLAAQGVAAEIADEMVRLAEDLHYLHYAPQLSTTGAVRDEVLARSRRLLRRLR